MTFSKGRAKSLGVLLRSFIIRGLHPFDSEDVATVG